MEPGGFRFCGPNDSGPKKRLRPGDFGSGLPSLAPKNGVLSMWDHYEEITEGHLGDPLNGRSPLLRVVLKSLMCGVPLPWEAPEKSCFLREPQP